MSQTPSQSLVPGGQAAGQPSAVVPAGADQPGQVAAGADSQAWAVLLPNERPVPVGNGSVAFGNLANHIAGLADVEDRREALTTAFHFGATSEAMGDSVKKAVYDFVTTNADFQAAVPDYKQWFADNFDNYQPATGRNRLAEAKNRVHRRYPDIDTFRGCQIPTKKFWEEMSTSIGHFHGNRTAGETLPFVNIIRPAYRQMILRLKARPSSSEYLLQTGDWIKAREGFVDRHLDPFSKAEIVELYNLRPALGLVVYADGFICPAAYQSQLGMQHLPVPGVGPEPAALPAAGTAGSDQSDDNVDPKVDDGDAAAAFLTGGVGNDPVDPEAAQDFFDAVQEQGELDAAVAEGIHSGRGCGCPNAALRSELLVRAKQCAPGRDQVVIGLLEWMMSHAVAETRRPDFCLSHIKQAIGFAGFHTRVLTANLVHERMTRFLANTDNLWALRNTGETARWFKAAWRSPRAADYRKTFKYAAEPNKSLFNKDEFGAQKAEEILTALFPDFDKTDFPNALGQFRTMGNTVLPAFTWLTGDKELLELCLEELKMYEFHLRLPDGASDLGWLRNCYYSIVQQAIRTDLGYYLAYVCLREDRQTHLISYPYYCKYTTKSSKTGFLHCDLNPWDASTGYGTKAIQGSVSLIDEAADHCTVIIPGFHMNVGQWRDTYEARGGRPLKGPVVNFKPTVYTAADKETFGDFTAVPCQAGNIRVTHPLIPHGSNAATAESSIRATILPWFVGIEPDGLTLELPAGGNFDELARAHREKVAAPRTPSGHPVIYGKTPGAFPAVGNLALQPGVQEALIGRASWTDRTVARQLKRLLNGPIEDMIKEVKESRERTKKEMRIALAEVQALELELYPRKGYFAWKATGFDPEFEPSDDDPDPVQDGADANSERHSSGSEHNSDEDNTNAKAALVASMVETEAEEGDEEEDESEDEDGEDNGEDDGDEDNADGDDEESADSTESNNEA